MPTTLPVVLLFYSVTFDILLLMFHGVTAIPFSLLHYRWVFPFVHSFCYCCWYSVIPTTVRANWRSHYHSFWWAKSCSGDGRFGDPVPHSDYVMRFYRFILILPPRPLHSMGVVRCLEFLHFIPRCYVLRYYDPVRSISFDTICSLHHSLLRYFLFYHYILPVWSYGGYDCSFDDPYILSPLFYGDVVRFILIDDALHPTTGRSYDLFVPICSVDTPYILRSYHSATFDILFCSVIPKRYVISPFVTIFVVLLPRFSRWYRYCIFGVHSYVRFLISTLIPSTLRSAHIFTHRSATTIPFVVCSRYIVSLFVGVLCLRFVDTFTVSTFTFHSSF